jgi:hypothetical protein
MNVMGVHPQGLLRKREQLSRPLQEETIMKRVTRNIDLERAQDLLERVPRACLTFASEQGPQAQPVGVVWQNGRYLAGLPRQAEQRPGSGQEVVPLKIVAWDYGTLREVRDER